MRYESDFPDYKVLDCSDGEKLEKIGGKVLVRPDPQIIWKSEKKNPLWKNPDGRYFRSEKGGGNWEFYKKMPEKWEIKYRDLTFVIKPTGFKHIGIFPEQAVNWSFMAEKVRNAGRPIKALNLFAYTGGATLALASAGAAVTHVDASKGVVAWARENAAASSLSDKPIRWIVDDCKKFAEREIRRGNKYDVIIMDPPSYGRGPTGEVWNLTDSIYDLLKTVSLLLSDNPLLFMLNSYTTGLGPGVMSYLLETAVAKGNGNVWADEIGIPVGENGLILPCGNTAVIEF